MYSHFQRLLHLKRRQRHVDTNITAYIMLSEMISFEPSPPVKLCISNA